MSLVIVDYGIGNLASIQNMLKKVGAPSVITSDRHEIAAADKLILAGVGAFDHCMESLHNSGLVELLNQKVLENNTPVLGICVGMQMLTQHSEEGTLPGLNWLGGRVIKFKVHEIPATLKIPHMGWADVTVNKPARLLEDIDEAPRFYFTHSYHADVDDKDVLLYASHGYRFAAAVERENIVGVQFHPEKSHRYGMQILSNFVNRY